MEYHFKCHIIGTNFHFPECGVSGAFNRRQPRNLSSLEHGRIINGKESPKGAWPWQVSMLLQFCFGLPHVQFVCYFLTDSMNIDLLK